MPRTRQLPTRDELGAWREFVETTDALRSVLSARMHSDSALSPGDYTVLLALSETDGHRMRSSDLASHIAWERSRLSHHLGRMQRRGLDPARGVRHRQPGCGDRAGRRGSGRLQRGHRPAPAGDPGTVRRRAHSGADRRRRRDRGRAAGAPRAAGRRGLRARRREVDYPDASIGAFVLLPPRFETDIWILGFDGGRRYVILRGRTDARPDRRRPASRPDSVAPRNG